MRVSFDFDGTLTDAKVFEIAEGYLRGGHEVFIVTARMEIDERRNGEVYILAQELGLSNENIVFTNKEPKYKFLKGFDVHYDNDATEISFIKENLPDCECFLVTKYKS